MCEVHKTAEELEANRQDYNMRLAERFYNKVSSDDEKTFQSRGQIRIVHGRGRSSFEYSGNFTVRKTTSDFSEKWFNYSLSSEGGWNYSFGALNSGWVREEDDEVATNFDRTFLEDGEHLCSTLTIKFS
jgi:hypothetical protein